MDQFVSSARALSCAGWRATHRARIAAALGKTMVPDDQFDVIVRVLESHLIRVTDTNPGAPGRKALKADSPTRTPRKNVTEGLEKAGFTTSFSEGSLCELARLYQTLQSDRTDISQAQVYANARFLHRFVKWGVKQPESDGEERRVIARPELATRFIKHLQGVISPYSVRNHAFAIRGFIDLLLTKPEADTRFAARTKPILREAQNVWGAIKNETNRAARRIQNAKIRSGSLESFPLYEICLFLRELRLGGTLTRYLAQLSNAKRDTGLPADLVVPYTTVMCVLACAMLFQGSRLSAVLGLTNAELIEQRKEVQGQFIVRIACHKTSRYSGPQPIVLHFVHYELFRQFCAAKKRLGLDTARIFTTHRDSTPNAEYLFGPLNKFLSLRLDTPTKITFNAMRKRIESSVFLLGDGNFRTAAEAGVSSYLAHSRDVNHRHYRFMTDDYVLEQSARVNEVLVQLVALDTVLDVNLAILPQNALGK